MERREDILRKRNTQYYLPIKGMNRDLGEGIYNNEYMYNIVNAKITHNNDLDLYRITSVKGTSLLSNTLGHTSYQGEAIGYCSINNYLVVFSTTRVNPNDYGIDYIHRFDINSDLVLNHKILYKSNPLFPNGELNFAKKNLIETLGNYESDDVVKVYWVDKENKPRFINIVQEDFGKPYIQNYSEQFSFVPDLNLKETFDVVKQDGGGVFHSGTVQYHFTYSNKNGAESNIFLSTGISFISHKDRGASKEETCYCSFRIVVDNLESEHFDTINVYASQRSDLNAPATVRVVGNFSINNKNSIDINDTGKGATVDSSILLYLGGDDIRIRTLNAKDGHLFGGDVELKRKHLKEIEDIIASEEDEFEDLKSVSLEWELKEYVKNNPLEYTISSLNDDEDYNEIEDAKYYDYEPKTLKYNTLGNNGVIRFFKTNEIYRFAIQAQYKNGVWGEAIYLGSDYRVNIDLDIKYNEDLESKDKVQYIKNNYTVKVPVPKLTIKDNIKTILRNKGYKKVRLLYVPLEKEDRNIISQGILNGTVANTKDRESNSPYSYSDYLLRTQPIVQDDFLESTLYEHSEVGALLLAEMGGFRNYKKYYYSQPRHVHASIISTIAGVGYSFQGGAGTTVVTYSPAYSEVYTNGNWLKYNKEDYPNPAKNRLLYNFKNGNNLEIDNIWFVDNSVMNVWSPEFVLDYYNKSNKINNFRVNFVGLTVLDKNFISLNSFFHNSQAKQNILNTNPFYASRFSSLDAIGNLSLETKENYIEKGDGKKIKEVLTNYHKGILRTESFDYLEYITYMANRVLDKGNFEELNEINITGLWDFYEPEGIKKSTSDFKDLSRNIYFGRNFYFNSNIEGPSYRHNYLLSILVKDSNFISHGSDKIIEVINNKTYKSNVNELALSLSKDNEENISGMNITSGMMSYKNNSHLMFELVSENSDDLNLNRKVTAYGPVDNKTKLLLPIHLHKAEFTDAPLEGMAIFNQMDYETEIKNNKFLADSTTLHIPNIFQYSTEISKFAVNPEEHNSRLDSMYLVEIEKQVSNQYGGYSKNSIMQNNFIPCSNGEIIDQENVIVYGIDGDTYYQRFDFIKTEPFDSNSEQKFTEGVSYMACSFINLDGRYDRHRYDPDLFAKHKGNFGLYNDAYSQLNNYFQYKTLDYINLNDDVKNSTVIYSKQKYNQELVDKWVNLNLLSSYDLDGRFGKINRIISYKNHILAFQDKGIASIIFNPRIQVATSDNVPIEISNSGKLEGHRYISEDKGCINKWAIVKSSNAVYFLDDFTRSINQFNGEGIIDLSVNYGFENWANKFISHNKEFDITTFDSFILNFDIIEGNLYINSSYKELPLNNNMDIKHWDVPNESDKAIDNVYLWDKTSYFQGSLVFNESFNFFEREMNYDKIPFMFNLSNIFMSVKNETDKFTLHKNNSGNFGEYYGKYYPIHLDYYIGDNYHIDKVFDNISYTMEVNSNDNFQSSITFNSFMASNNYQSSYMKLYNNGKPSYQLRKRFNTWSFPCPRQLKSMNRIRGKYARFKLKFNYPNDNYFLSMDKMLVNYTI